MHAESENDQFDLEEASLEDQLAQLQLGPEGYKSGFGSSHAPILYKKTQ